MIGQPSDDIDSFHHSDSGLGICVSCAMYVYPRYQKLCAKQDAWTSELGVSSKKSNRQSKYYYVLDN